MRQYLISLYRTYYFLIFLIVFIFATIIPTLSDAMHVYSTINGSLERYVRKAGDKEEVCSNDDCKAVSKRLKAMMDFSTDPCEDFYRFTCGKFLELEIPASLGSLSTFTFLKNIVAKRIKQNLENPIDNSTDPLFVRNAKNFYILCKNHNQREKDDSRILKKLLEKFGGWPIIVGDNWDEGKFSWLDLLKKFRSSGLDTNYLFTLTVGINLKNSSQRMIELDAADTIIDGRQIDEDIKGHRFTRAYHNLILNIALLLGADKTKVEEELWEVVTLEAALAKSKYLSVNSKEFLTWTLDELTQKNDQIPWKKFITELFLDYSIAIADDEPLSIQNEGFLNSINRLLSAAPNRVVANYLMWRAIFSLITELPTKFFYVYEKFQEEAYDIKAAPEPWVHCISTVSELYRFVLSYQYVSSYFDDEAKKQAEELVGDIKREVTQSLIWLDQSSQDEAIKKLNIMEAYVGYPEELLEEKKVQDFYGDIVITQKDSYLQSYLKINKLLIDLQYKRLRTLLNKTDWKRHAEVTDVNAFYSVVDNSIYLPAAVLQGPFFGKGRPRYMNYGGIGFVIGHEMTHAFDIQGSLFDFAGNMRDWWTANSKKHYLQRADCVDKQFDKYKVKQINKRVNGKRTASENMADSGGLKAAYSAYFNKHISEPAVIGFEKFTAKQMFWISAASIWCTIYRNDSLKHLVRNGVHSPGEFRVNGALSNQKSFAEDFNCPIGSPMNPKMKCSVWDS